MEELKRLSKGIWIPIEIWECTNLSINEKVLFAEIDSYTNKDKDCYMSDEYISNFLGISTTNANKTLSSLIKKGFVVKTRFDGRHRYIKAALSISTKQPCQSQQGFCACDNNNDNNNIILPNKLPNNKEKESQKRKRNEYSEDFEKAWGLAHRKGSKTEAYRYWLRLKDEDKEKVFAHLPFYYKSNDIRYLKDFSGYLNRVYYGSVVYDKQGRIMYDPERQNSTIYRPACDGALSWNDYYKCFMYVGFWDGEHIPDGYNDDNRPNGASVTLNNGRGVLVWNSETKKWEKK